MKTFAEAEQVLAESLPGYESRPQQQALAVAVEQALAEGTLQDPIVLLAEAGCGTGKSLGLMIPALLAKRRTVVATATKALQEQYAAKDVPFLQENLGIDFRWALLKGRSNYVCLAKVQDVQNLAANPWMADVLTELRDNPDHDGDIEHLATDIPEGKAYLATISSVDCPGASECPFGQQCLSQAAKARAAKADLVITNTAMLMTDLVVREASDGVASLLGSYEAVIIDEAHETEEWATNALSVEMRPRGIEQLIAQATNWSGAQGADLPEADTATDALDVAWSTLSSFTGTKEAVRLAHSWWIANGDAWADLSEALGALDKALYNVQITGGDVKKEGARRQIIRKRIANTIVKIERLLLDSDDATVRWVDTTKTARVGEVLTLHTAPVHVGNFLASTLWSQVSVAILASATMSVGGSFAFISERLGIEAPKTIDVGTPFDYATQARTFLPDRSQPSPKARDAWMRYSSETTMDLVEASGGAALLLFTSRAAMQASHRVLAPRLARMGHTVLMQGEAPNADLARRFKEDTSSVLFALRSFFTGVDFSGDTLRLVVIDKLPFPVPTEPVFAARAEQVKARGGSDFSGLSVPIMTLILTQAFGRLIRSKTDSGVVAILDSRLTSTPWGAKIARSLPPAPVVTDLKAAQAFLA